MRPFGGRIPDGVDHAAALILRRVIHAFGEAAFSDHTLMFGRVIHASGEAAFGDHTLIRRSPHGVGGAGLIDSPHNHGGKRDIDGRSVALESGSCG